MGQLILSVHSWVTHTTCVNYCIKLITLYVVEQLHYSSGVYEFFSYEAVGDTRNK